MNIGICNKNGSFFCNSNGETKYNFTRSFINHIFNIDTHTHTYLKSAVEKLKNSGVEYIFIDEISMINSKIWGVLSDIKKKYNLMTINNNDDYKDFFDMIFAE